MAVTLASGEVRPALAALAFCASVIERRDLGDPGVPMLRWLRPAVVAADPCRLARHVTAVTVLDAALGGGAPVEVAIDGRELADALHALADHVDEAEDDQDPLPGEAFRRLAARLMAELHPSTAAGG